MSDASLALRALAPAAGPPAHAQAHRRGGLGSLQGREPGRPVLDTLADFGVIGYRVRSAPGIYVRLAFKEVAIRLEGHLSRRLA